MYCWFLDGVINVLLTPVHSHQCTFGVHGASIDAPKASIGSQRASSMYLEARDTLMIKLWGHGQTMSNFSSNLLSD